MGLRNGPSYEPYQGEGTPLVPINSAPPPLFDSPVEYFANNPQKAQNQEISSEKKFYNSENEHSSEVLEQISENMSNELDRAIESVTPKNLKNLSPDVINAAINHNSHSRRHLNNERVTRAHRAIDFLSKQGIPLHIAIGIIANAVAENGLQTDNSKHGLGLFQWIGARRNQFYKMKGSLSGSDDFEKQLSFMLHELKTSEKNAGNALQGARTAEEAARIFMLKFERPASKDTSPRSAIATALLKLTHQHA